MPHRRYRPLLSLVAVVLISLVAGCAQMGLEYAPKGPYLAYHKELPAAERAVEAARAAGKDRECPEQFQAAERLKNDAYTTYWACRTNEAIAMANRAASLANAPCPPRPAAVPVVPPPPPRPAAPAVTLSRDPAAIQAGQCSTLSWAATNATSATIEGIGAVAPSGSQQVCPTESTSYLITATGPGGTQTASATVGVTPPPPPPPPAPTVRLEANPAAIQAGQCSTLTWTATDATKAAIDPGIGGVPLTGSQQVCPTASTTYRITATASDGFFQTAATTVGVTAPPPPPPAAPGISLAASPAAIQAGQCSTLTWTTTNATAASIDPGVGTVDPSGSRQVCPTTPTSYQLTATGPGGTRTASTSVAVTAPPPPPAPAPLPAPAPPRLTLHINFDTNKAAIRAADRAELQKALDFVKQHPGSRIAIEGHTDSTGETQYNQGLSERRAAAVKDYLVKNGVPGAQQFTTVGYGESKPIASNRTAQGRFQNRRVEITVLP